MESGLNATARDFARFGLLMAADLHLAGQRRRHRAPRPAPWLDGGRWFELARRMADELGPRTALASLSAR